MGVTGDVLPSRRNSAGGRWVPSHIKVVFIPSIGTNITFSFKDGSTWNLNRFDLILIGFSRQDKTDSYTLPGAGPIHPDQEEAAARRLAYHPRTPADSPVERIWGNTGVRKAVYQSEVVIHPHGGSSGILPNADVYLCGSAALACEFPDFPIALVSYIESKAFEPLALGKGGLQDRVRFSAMEVQSNSENPNNKEGSLTSHIGSWIASHHHLLEAPEYWPMTQLNLYPARPKYEAPWTLTGGP